MLLQALKVSDPSNEHGSYPETDEEQKKDQPPQPAEQIAQKRKAVGKKLALTEY
jgi:hypothetical protein